MPKLLIAASGTGGHIFPAIAVAEALPKSWEINWLGVPDRLETILVPQAYRLHTLRVEGLQGNFLKKIFQIIRLFLSTFKVIYLIKSRGIQIIFATGGYIAAPAILAAKICSIKIILHESNAYPGRVTRLMGSLCDFVAIGFPKTEKYLPRCNTVLTGTPVRKEFKVPQFLPIWVPSGSGPLIVVIGGSQGAIGLNNMVRSIFPSLLNKGCRIVHLTGRKDKNFVSIKHCNLVIREFSNEMPALIQNADLVISRAGSCTISELTVCCTPSVLVPYPFASNDHQNYNAANYAKTGSALIVHQNESDQRTLLRVINRLLKSRLNTSCKSQDYLKIMQNRIKKISIKQSEIELINILINEI